MLTRQMIFSLLMAGTCTLADATEKLPRLGADPTQTSVSGLSSGAFMAVQMQVAYSKSIIGSGVVAGGPYYCAANNIMFTAICMGQVPFFPPNAALMAQAARQFERARTIDALKHLSTRRVYVFSGRDDTVVRPPAVNATVSFFNQVGVTGDRLKFVNDLPAGHALISPGQGNECSINAAPYINHCSTSGHAYDQAGDLLQHIYGPLQPRSATAEGKVVPFNQREFAPASSGLSDEAYLYVPQSCSKADANCKVHVALHGCEQSAEVLGARYYTETGYNEWADANGLLILYPQVSKIAGNPNGCWDWWGYSGTGYAKKSGPQMKAIWAMVLRLQKQP